jgi:hypothetical protein
MKRKLYAYIVIDARFTNKTKRQIKKYNEKNSKGGDFGLSVTVRYVTFDALPLPRQDRLASLANLVLRRAVALRFFVLFIKWVNLLTGYRAEYFLFFKR